MAGGRKPGAATGGLEQQIEKAQENVIKTKQNYENAVEVLQKLLDKHLYRKYRDSLKMLLTHFKMNDKIKTERGATDRRLVQNIMICKKVTIPLAEGRLLFCISDNF